MANAKNLINSNKIKDISKLEVLRRNKKTDNKNKISTNYLKDEERKGPLGHTCWDVTINKIIKRENNKIKSIKTPEGE